MRLAGEMKRERDEEREKEEILFELHEGRVREAERRKEAIELELEIRAVLLSTTTSIGQTTSNNILCYDENSQLVYSHSCLEWSSRILHQNWSIPFRVRCLRDANLKPRKITIHRVYRFCFAIATDPGS